MYVYSTDDEINKRERMELRKNKNLTILGFFGRLTLGQTKICMCACFRLPIVPKFGSPN